LKDAHQDTEQGIVKEDVGEREDIIEWTGLHINVVAINVNPWNNLPHNPVDFSSLSKFKRCLIRADLSK